MSEQSASVPLFFLIAGEASGDLLGARLMQALKRQTAGRVRFAGIGGPRMVAEGLDLLFPQAELAHMGLIEILRHIPHLLGRIRQTVATILARKPAALITIDSPDFSLRVARKLKGQGIPLIHYVAPSVWAWRPGRAKKVAQYLDHLLALLPFEPPYFTKEGLPCTFVGHPLVEGEAGKGDAARFRIKFDIPAERTLIAVLPGSRMGEVSKLLPVFRETIERIKTRYPQLHLVVPTAPGVADFVTNEVQGWSVPVTFTDNDGDKYDGFAACRAALACSGTVSVELAMAGLPSVIAYKIHPLTAALYRRLIKSRFVTLLNIMQDRMVMPELLQEECTPEKLAAAMLPLMEESPERSVQTQALHRIAAWLGRGQFVPSEKAAQTVWQVAFPAREEGL